jgi:hypothetical protein
MYGEKNLRIEKSGQKPRSLIENVPAAVSLVRSSILLSGLTRHRE